MECLLLKQVKLPRIENRAYQKPAAILLSSTQISPVITGHPNSAFVSVQ